jgi:hypothetical protein
VVAAGRHLTKLFEGRIVATPDRRRFRHGRLKRRRRG